MFIFLPHDLAPYSSREIPSVTRALKGTSEVSNGPVYILYKCYHHGENSQRGIGENVGAFTALEYMMERNFVERNSK